MESTKFFSTLFLSLPSHMPSSLEVQLTKALQPFPAGVTFEIFDLPTKSESCDLYYGGQEPTIQHVQRLILVAARSTSDSESLLVLGIEANEYKVDQGGSLKTIVYIGKVDTSGAELNELAKSGVTRKVVAAYIKSLGDCTVFFTAVAQQQYLFPDSKKNKNKHVLQNKDLVKWWRRTLLGIQQDLQGETQVEPEPEPGPEPESKEAAFQEQESVPTSKHFGILNRVYHWFTGSSSNKDKQAAKSPKEPTVCQGWWNIPSFSKDEAYREFGILASQENRSFWTYGHPFDQTARVNTTIPCFPDDPVGRMIRYINDPFRKDTNQPDGPTVREFWQLLCVAQEFNYGSYNCIFAMRIKNSELVESSDIQHTNSGVDSDTYTYLWNTLMEGKFIDNETNKSTTSTFMRRWEEKGLSKPFKITSNGEPILQSKSATTMSEV